MPFIELSLRRKLFLQEHADITKNPLNYEYNPEFEFGESEEKFTNKELIGSFKQINKTNVTFAIHKNMLFVLNNIETIHIEKEKEKIVNEVFSWHENY